MNLTQESSGGLWGSVWLAGGGGVQHGRQLSCERSLLGLKEGLAPTPGDEQFLLGGRWRVPPHALQILGWLPQWTATPAGQPGKRALNRRPSCESSRQSGWSGQRPSQASERGWVLSWLPGRLGARPSRRVENLDRLEGRQQAQLEPLVSVPPRPGHFGCCPTPTARSGGVCAVCAEGMSCSGLSPPRSSPPNPHPHPRLKGFSLPQGQDGKDRVSP